MGGRVCTLVKPPFRSGLDGRCSQYANYGLQLLSLDTGTSGLSCFEGTLFWGAAVLRESHAETSLFRGPG